MVFETALENTNPVLSSDLIEEFHSSNAALIEAEMEIWPEEVNRNIGDVYQTLLDEEVSV